ncbi:hypothetical protein A3K63_01670 [Candidatus Micrarchaeota archaeon RBG_16_49_10]|nr:MAG: hypothetical protein A3K63_01670 [Candidatus Micrarchaeota archaeon RBG_16_49_10]
MDLFGLPKSARKILIALSISDSLTQRQIQSLSGLSMRSVKGSLILLKDKGLVEELIDLTDMRCRAYRLGGEP